MLSCTATPVAPNLIDRLTLLPDMLFATVLTFDRGAFEVLQLVATKANEKVLSLLQFSQGEIVERARRKKTFLYQRILSLSSSATTQKFHDLLYANASMHGGKWGLHCQKYAMPQEIRTINSKIRKRRNEHCMKLWSLLRPTIELTQTPGPNFPKPHDLPETILTWIEQNQNLCFGINLQSLPLSEKKLDSLKLQLNVFTKLAGRGRMPNLYPHSIISEPVFVDGEMQLRSRLAEDLDCHLLNQGIHFFGQAIKITNMALNELLDFFKEGREQNATHTHTSINVHCSRYPNDLVSYDIKIFYDNKIDAAADPSIALLFYVMQDLSKAYYFYERSLRRRITESLEQQMDFLKVTEQERAENLGGYVNASISYLRKLHLGQFRNHHAPEYLASYFQLTRNTEGFLEVSAETNGSYVGVTPLNVTPVLLRFYFSDVIRK